MADVFDFYVYDNRSIAHTSPEPIMQEDKDVAVWRFRIPKVLNNIDMSAWAWWFVYVNARGQKFSELLTLNNDIDDPEEYSIADYSIGYGISKTPGGFTFALEAINTEQGGEISGEWHTRTYTHTVTPTLQGNQAEYAETESDVISALMQEVRNKVNQLVGGATPLPVALKSLMTDHDKVYLYTGSETGESTGYWYHWNGTNFVPGGVYGAGDPESVQGYVEDWLDDHPEATTTVQDGAITEQKLADALKLKVIKDYVTPEMFGAVGDGVTDDTSALNQAFANGAVWLKRGAVYKCSNVNIASNSIIIGNGATIDSGNASGFIIKKTVHDVLITDINFESEFTVGDTETASNTCILIKASNTTEEYEAYNIEISRCKFNCGVFGIAATSVQNLHIHDCEFYGAVYRPEDNAGGYAILTQSCSNVTIERCYFQLGKYSRHDIYVSVSQAKTANISSRNYRILNCFSDKSLITENAGDAFYSSTIASVVVRSIYNFLIENYRLYNGTGLIFFNTTDGSVVNATIKNCINDTPRFKASSVMASEMRQSYGFSGITGSDVKFENCKTLNNSSLYFLEYKVSGGIIEICNTTIASPFEVGDCDYLHLHELYVLGSYFRFTGTGVLKGKFHSIDSDGNYIFGASTNVDNGAYIDINAYEDKLLGPWTIASNGSLTFNTGKLHIGASASVESNDHGTIITLAYCKRPLAITRTMPLTDGCVMEANVSSSSIADNQVRFRKFNLADGSAASSRSCRFYLC